MEKTRLGISVGLLGAIAYVLTGFSGYVPALLIAGYVLLFEENEWLKRSCVKAVVLAVCFTLIVGAIGLIPDLLSWVSSTVTLFDGSFNYSQVNTVISLFTRALNIIEDCLFILLAVKALKQGNLSVPVVDEMIDKHI